MIFRQLFDSVSVTYTYLIASRLGGEALIIDPVLEKVDRYLQLVSELDLKLVKAVDTHLHADHVTGLGALRDRTHCITVMGEQTNADVVSMRVTEGECVEIEGLSLDVLKADRLTFTIMVNRSMSRNHRFCGTANGK
jgi:sulfur dioxygenase